MINLIRRRDRDEEASYPSFLDTDTSLWLKGDNPLNTNIRWYDASPNNHVLNGTATLTDSVLNGQKGYVFNGSSDYFDGGDILDFGTNNRTMITIGSINSYNGCFFSKSIAQSLNNRWTLIKINGCISAYVDVPCIYYSSSNSFMNHKIIQDRSSNLSYYVNGILKGHNSASQTDFQTSYKFLVGAYNNTSGTVPPLAGYYLNGTICEIIFFDRLLTTAETTQLNAYLTLKYGTL